MIVFDGDSVVLQKGYGIDAEKSWPHLAAKGIPYVNVGVHMSTAHDVHERLTGTLDFKPDWYVLQIGQWSQNHEELSTFEYFVRKICERVNLKGVGIILVTPCVQVIEGLDPKPYVSVLEQLSKIYRTQFVNTYTMLEKGGPTIDSLVVDDHSKCHFNEAGAILMAEYFNRSVNLDIV